jgi:hypothetical protein
MAECVWFPLSFPSNLPLDIRYLRDFRFFHFISISFHFIYLFLFVCYYFGLFSRFVVLLVPHIIIMGKYTTSLELTKQSRDMIY